MLSLCKDVPVKNSRPLSNLYVAPSGLPLVPSSLPLPGFSPSCKSTPKNVVLKGIFANGVTSVTVSLRSVLLAKLPECTIDTYYRSLPLSLSRSLFLLCPDSRRDGITKYKRVLAVIIPCRFNFPSSCGHNILVIRKPDKKNC